MMAARFADIKFNLMRAIELFQDMNYLDMDVSAPPSNNTFYKEIEVAQRLNIFLGELIKEGVFDECEFRDNDGDEHTANNCDEEYVEDYWDEECTTPRSEGFEYEPENSGDLDDDDEEEEEDFGQSFADRFKSYLRRIMPAKRRGFNKRRYNQEQGEQGVESDKSRERQVEDIPCLVRT